MLRSVAVYLHPIAGLATTALAGYAASLGLRSRLAGGGGEAARRRHAAIGPWVYGLMLLNWMGGVASVRWLRPEIELADSGHFVVGSAIAALFTATAILSRWVPVDARARAIHPLLGATALLCCGLQIFLGLQLLP